MVNEALDITKEIWHSLAADEVIKRLEVDISTGLSSDEVKKRRDRFGLNQITPKKGTPLWLRFLLQFHQPLIYILLVATATTLFLKEWVDASVIFGVVLINAIVGFLQEAKALKALEALSRSMTSSVSVLRDGKEQQISSIELVPGDVVMIASGDKITADMRLIYSRDLQTNESPLTGESVPVEKQIKPLDEKTVLADRLNMLYASIFVTYGRGKAVVAATGDATEVGRISELITTAEDLETPLTIKIAHFSRYLLFVIMGLAALTFVVGVLRGQAFVEMFMAAIALAVGAIPEGLPAAVTITLAIGVARMAKRRAIIRKLPAVETLGSTGVICSDKTGTLTENQMTVQEIFSAGQIYQVSGVGYSFEGAIQEFSRKSGAISSIALKECLTAGLLCNDSRIVERQGLFQVEGDPTEAALIVSANKGKSLFPAGMPVLPRKDSIPFESEYQYMATFHILPNGDGIVYLKGSTEKILAKCVNHLDENGEIRPLKRALIEHQIEIMAAKGLRVLAFARDSISSQKDSIDHSDITESFTLLGLQGMIDPPRKEAIEAVRRCHSAGILVKMITGDHVLTAKAIAGQLNLKSRLDAEESVKSLVALSGSELENMNDEELQGSVDRVSVFARVTPEQKLRLVKALQARGYIVAMTGDGVNDAPALKQANIGVAMGRTGTEVAKEAADMVLTDDNFASIEAAVEEGRCVFDNLRKFIVWTLPTNAGEALATMVAIFGGIVLPVAPVQLLWINMTTALCLGMMLAFESKEPDLMQQPPRDPKMPIMTGDLIARTIVVGVFLALGVFGLFFYERNNGLSIEEARTAAVGVLVIGELFYLFNCRSLSRPMFVLGVFSNRWLISGVLIMIGLQMLFTYSPVMNRFFHSAPISLNAWVRIFLIGLLIYVIIEIEKWGRSRFLNRKQP
ncbi:MAG: cation-transporting P-type ATPase [Candidatus Omnitrophica bacterium]|nr:cation-transporting P-type ATPase [Candidatus Omnitrophota bacterium]MDD5592525.1 cation-transporting P-type ATPase [Candidatus Omnitrophota bacterium]